MSLASGTLALGIKLVHFVSQMAQRSMNLVETMNAVRSCATQMNAQYGKPVFDEWAVVSLLRQQARVLGYVGPRNDEFLKSFADDLGQLRAALLNGNYQVGDFEFARDN